MNSGNTVKYFKYAIGEIILVVIGILIALQINNWNEQRKINDQVEELFTKAYKELEYNLLNVNNLIKFYRLKDPHIYRVRALDIKPAEFDWGKLCIDCVLSGYEVLNISDYAANNLFSYNSKVSKDLKTLMEMLDNLYKDHKDILDDDDRYMENIVVDHNNFIRDSKPWLHAFNSPKLKLYKAEVLNYFLLDPIYENWVAQYEQRGLSHTGNALQFKSEALTLYNKISDYFGLERDRLLAPDLEAYKHLLGRYRNTYGMVDLMLKENNFHYKFNKRFRGQREGNFYIDSDSTAVALFGFITFKQDTMVVSAGGSSKVRFIKE